MSGSHRIPDRLDARRGRISRLAMLRIRKVVSKHRDANFRQSLGNRLKRLVPHRSACSVTQHKEMSRIIRPE